MEEFPAEECQYRLRADKVFLMTIAGSFTEMLQNFPHLHLPEPFDIVNHAGNFWGGTTTAIAMAATYGILYGVNNGTDLKISEQHMATFRKAIIPAILVTTFLLNCITETRWGVDHLPFAHWLGGTTPDVLDSVYSTAYAGVASAVIWEEVRR